MTGGWEEVEESVHPAVCHPFPHHSVIQIQNTTLCVKYVQISPYDTNTNTTLCVR